MTIDINMLRVAVTVVSFAVFVGILLWAASGRNRERFDEAARIPLEDDSPSPPSGALRQGEGANVGHGLAGRGAGG